MEMCGSWGAAPDQSSLGQLVSVSLRDKQPLIDLHKHSTSLGPRELPI